MQKHKIVNFEKTGEGKFPCFRKVEPEEIKSLREELSTKLVSKFGLDINTFLESFDSIGCEMKDVNAQNDNFILNLLFKELRISPKENVFINWYRFDDIDEMSFEDLDLNFDDVWYPGSDDIDIFDSTKCWLISISHDGYVKYFDLCS